MLTFYYVCMTKEEKGGRSIYAGKMIQRGDKPEGVTLGINAGNASILVWACVGSVLPSFMQIAVMTRRTISMTMLVSARRVSVYISAAHLYCWRKLSLP